MADHSTVMLSSSSLGSLAPGLRPKVRALPGVLLHGARQVRTRDIAPIGFLTVASIVGTALAPVLHSDGMLLALMSPRLVFLGVAAHQNSFVPFVVLATIRLCLADPFHYRLGRAHGPALLARSGRMGRWLTRFGSRPWVVVAAIAIRPIGRHLMWAGTRRVNPLLVGATDLVATALFCVAVKTGVDLLPLP